MIKKRILSNNITLLIQSEENSSAVSIGFWYSVGSRNEKEGQFGITHFTEHMLFKGTSSRSTHDISCRFDRMGGYLNAFTEREDVCVYCTFPYSEKNVIDACEIICDMAENCTFPQNEMDKERVVVENEIVAVGDDPEESALDFVAASVWPDQSISRSITGTIDDVESITRDDMIKWYDENFVHGELTVVAAGKVDDEILSSILEKLPVHRKCKNFPDEKHFNEDVRWSNGNFFKKSVFNQSQLYMLYPLNPVIGEKENYVMSVFNAVAGDTMSSRLFESLREKNGLCYSVYSFFTIYEDACAWCAAATSEKSRTVQAAELLHVELNNLLEKEITDDELEAAKEHICGEELLLSSDTEYMMKRLQRNYSMGFALLDTKQTVEYIRTITKNDIMELVRKLIIEDNKSFVFFGPGLSGKQKRQILCRMK